MTTTTAGSSGAAAPSRGASPFLEISYFTDPLCCWSWGFEPQLRRLRHGFAGRIAWRLRMCGMIFDWNRFSDPLNDVHRPAQMGPMWNHTATITGMQVEPAIWVHDAPASSWPSCLAVKAAGLQSPAAADLYLRRTREAVMTEGRNIGREDVLIEISRTLARLRPDIFDAERFRVDFAGREARAALVEDVREARLRGIGRFPCLGLRRPVAEAVWLVGWRPYGALLQAVREFAPELGQERRVEDPEHYRTYWSGATDREIAEVDSSASEPSWLSAGSLSSGAGANRHK